MQRRSQRIAYRPGTVVRWDETSNWNCYCDSGVPVGDEPEQDGKECFECTTCNTNWGRVKCYGLTEIYKDKTKWPQWEACCIACSGADATLLPEPIQAPTAPLTKEEMQYDLHHRM